ncbi:TOMM precursor leader peptide-binding protein [Streptomyces sp. TRM 70351]|uniref:TOMM precursor leader peptide-binding protein n=1 Tax=Streptomyces sp. TRM 70351 TaxID=3116552 RepID=UPI002E7B2BE8|nr:TOMM precursor leader peptide-binding protein [Streptomyces sp. TRM 70351]MEE1926715.1 TOMM precursor leader peptide-binding protein [Streptomyces sp. TRM 70351]
MATTAYEETAGTRPRVRRDVLFTETPTGVIFHNADGGFQLTAKAAYRFATLMVPHLDGSRSVADLCAGFGDQQKAMVGALVKALYERGFARPVPEPGAGAAATDPAAAARFAEQIAYIDHYADDADTRFARFRGTRVAVLGDGPVARWCVLSLIRNGCAAVAAAPGRAPGQAAPGWLEEAGREAAELTAEGCPVELTVLPGTRSGAAADEPHAGWEAYGGYDVVVAASGPAAPGAVLRLLRQGVPEGRTLLPAWTFGGRAVVGPVMTDGAPGCWSCAALRLGAAGPDPAAADLWSGVALGTGTRGQQPAGPLAAMLGNLLGYEVFRLVTGALPDETRGRLLIQDMASFDVASEPLLPHPRCPFCTPDATASGPEAVDLAAAPARPAFLPTVATAPDDEAAEGPLAELERRSALVRPHAGVFSRYVDEPLTQTPLKVGAVELGLGPRGPRTITAFDVHHTAGARLRALNAAATVYAEHVVPAAPAPAGTSFTELLGRLPTVDAAALTVATGAGADGGVPGTWALATSLLSKEQVLVPAAAVRPLGPDNADRRFEPGGAGAGAGGGLPEAAAAGLLSALAHDALQRAVRGAAGVVTIPPGGFGDDPEMTFLLRSAGHLGLDVELLDLGERAHTGVSVVLARSAGTGGTARWAVGAALDAAGAAVDAVRDLLGAEQLAAEGAQDAPDGGDPLLRELDAALVPVTGTGWSPAGTAPGWTGVLDRLAAGGRDAFVVPTHAADLPTAGIHTVRVLLTRAVADAR